MPYGSGHEELVLLGKKFEYLVEYKGYPLHRDFEWRPQAELEECAGTMLKNFNELFDESS